MASLIGLYAVVAFMCCTCSGFLSDVLRHTEPGLRIKSHDDGLHLLESETDATNDVLQEKSVTLTSLRHEKVENKYKLHTNNMRSDNIHLALIFGHRRPILNHASKQKLWEEINERSTLKDQPTKRTSKTITKQLHAKHHKRNTKNMLNHKLLHIIHKRYSIDKKGAEHDDRGNDINHGNDADDVDDDKHEDDDVNEADDEPDPDDAYDVHGTHLLNHFMDQVSKGHVTSTNVAHWMAQIQHSVHTGRLSMDTVNRFMEQFKQTSLGQSFGDKCCYFG